MLITRGRSPPCLALTPRWCKDRLQGGIFLGSGTWMPVSQHSHGFWELSAEGKRERKRSDTVTVNNTLNNTQRMGSSQSLKKKVFSLFCLNFLRDGVVWWLDVIYLFFYSSHITAIYNDCYNTLTLGTPSVTTSAYRTLCHSNNSTHF